MNDCISRHAAIDVICKACAMEEDYHKCDGYPETSTWCDSLVALRALPSAQPDLDEWCTDCSEYDQERHCCPRWNRVIRQTLKDAQQERKTGEWILCSEKLSEANGRYLVTRGLSACGAMWNRVYLINYSDLMGLKSERIWWDGNVGKSDFERIDDVIAWMPLPEPYMGGKDE